MGAQAGRRSLALGELIVALGALIVALGVPVWPGAAGAASLDAAGTTILAFSDTSPLPLPAPLNTELASLRSLYCAGTGKPSSVTLAAGLQAATVLVQANSDNKGMAAISASPAGHGEAIAIAAAAGALGAGRPAGALAALLRAHQLAPRDPMPLIDAAPLLTMAGEGNQALALLEAARKLKGPPPTPSASVGRPWWPPTRARRSSLPIAIPAPRRP